jgi:hypothetical protein
MTVTRRVIRQASTLAVAPSNEALDAQHEPDAQAEAQSEPEVPPAPEAPRRRRRGSAAATAPAAPANAETAPAAAPSVPANLPTLSAQTLQGLGLLYVLARSMGTTPDVAVQLLREAIAAHDELSSPKGL